MNHFSIIRSTLCVAALLSAGGAAVQAATLDLFTYGTTGTPPAGHVWQLDVSVASGTATFTFTKSRGGQGYGLTDIYFESGLSTLLTGTPTISTPVNTNQVDVAFMEGAGVLGGPDEDPLVPGSANPWAGNLAHVFSFQTTFQQGSQTRTATAQDDSLDRNNESVTISWSYAGTENDLVTALLDGSGNSRLAIRVNQNQGNGVCNTSNCGLSTVNPVPLPPAAWLLGSALVGMVSIGRRRRAA